MKIHHHIRSFEQVLKSYDGSIPLHRHLLSYFRLNKQMGSQDRRWASRYIYAYFRLGKVLSHLSDLERVAIADFLCHDNPSLIAAEYLPELINQVDLSLERKLELIQEKYSNFNWNDLFPFQKELALGVEKEHFFKSLLVQPDLFIRLSASDLSKVKLLLQDSSIAFKELGVTCLALPNGTKLENVLKGVSYQVQDYSSQQTGAYFKPQAGEYWWDCCAASGGKSLLLHSLEPTVKLLVSDVRETSLGNLQERFAQVGLKQYQTKVLNLTLNNDHLLHHYEFDGILLDAPCSGSGTWGRTPEMLSFFEEDKVTFYADLQKKIATNVIKYLKSGKPLIYMTCSVFAEENEQVVDYLIANLPLKLEHQQLISGIGNKADSMFVARLIKVD